MRILLLLLLSGCSTVSEVLPSLKYCEHVLYERTGRNIQLEAECTLPAGVDLPL